MKFNRFLFKNQFQWLGPKRYRPPACTIDDLPEGLEVVVISHTHYDHLDYNSVRALNRRFGSKLHWFVPQGVGKWLRDNVGCQNIHDMVWWQEETMPNSTAKVSI